MKGKSKFKSRFILPVIPEFDQLETMLSLIDKKVTKKEFNKWSDKKRFYAYEYAVSQHLRASDNIIYKPPKEPLYVKQLKEVK